MKILQLCHKPPFPPNDGGTKAMHANTIALQKLGHEVHVLTIETPKHPVLWADLEGDYIHTTDFTAYFENTTPSKYDAFQAFLFNENYHLERFNIPEFHALVQKKLADVEYDVVWLESLYMACYIETVRNASAIPIILRAHNVEYQLWDHRLEEYSFPSSLFIKAFNKQLKQTEKEVFKKVNAIAAISDKDALLIKPDANSTPLHTLPYFVEEKASETSTKTFTFGYIGALDWEPNIQGVLWLVNEVWPVVKQKLPEAELHIAGRNMDQRIKEIQQDGVLVYGEVDDSDEFIRSAQILTVPLFSSSGIRIKLIEAFAAKKAVVASSAATNGLNEGVKSASIIADSSSQFAQSMVQLAMNESERYHLEQQAFNYYQSNYSEHLYLKRLTDLMKEVVS
jgi:glycosyltransferase involved in cell wall biosynthesis